MALGFSNFGWAMDGVCDGFGDIFRFIAFVFVLHRVLGNVKISGSSYQLLDIERNLIFSSKSSESGACKAFICRLYQLSTPNYHYGVHLPAVIGVLHSVELLHDQLPQGAGD